MSAATRLLPLLAAAAVTAAAGCREQRATPRIEPVATPIPERGNRAQAAASQAPAQAPPAAPQPPGPADDAAGRARFHTPGAVRWSVELPRPISGIAWLPSGGLAVSAGPAVHNVTSRGVERWTLVAGEGHRLFRLGGQQVVWSPAFQRIMEIDNRGQVGWKREWTGGIAEDPRGGFLLVDAATVAAVGADGRDRWRVSLDGLRRLRGPFPCRDGVVFQGVRGLESTAVTISDHGMVVRELALERGSLLLGTGIGCEPLIWRGGEVAMLDPRGIERWRRPLAREPLVSPVDSGFLLVTGAATGAIAALVLDAEGRPIWTADLPVAGRMTRIDPLAVRAGRPTALGLCLDVSSPCARPGELRGPYNALLTPGADGRMRVLARHTRGHLAVAPDPAGGLLVASSSAEDATEVARRGADDIVRWQVALPGRLSAGPFVGPSGEVYVATCGGWECGPPFRLAAITGAEPAQAPADP
jgi:hypothetical protein